MKVEGNATALMQDLKKKKFSAFVYQHGNDNLYRVGVGPFGDRGFQREGEVGAREKRLQDDHGEVDERQRLSELVGSAVWAMPEPQGECQGSTGTSPSTITSSA